MAKKSKNQIYCKKCEKKTDHWDNKGTDKEKEYGMFACTICKNPYTPKKDSEKTSTRKYKTYPNDSVLKSMYGAWAVNLSIAFVEKDLVKTKEDVKELVQYFVAEVGTILNGNNPALTTKSEIETSELDTIDETSEEVKEDSDGVVEDLDLDLENLNI